MCEHNNTICKLQREGVDYTRLDFCTKCGTPSKCTHFIKKYTTTTKYGRTGLGTTFDDADDSVTLLPDYLG